MIKKGALGFLWVIHIAALIGIALGHKAFFFPKSPFTMLYLLLVLVIWYPVNTFKKGLLFLICFATGMTVEWIGVHTSYLFGTYEYLENFGLKIDGIPLLIGVNWGILVFITHEMARHFTQNKFATAAIGAGLMVFLDFFLEQICAYAGFWKFTDGAGWYNYACWFVIGYALQLLATSFNLQGDKQTAYNLYLAQTLFAAVLWILITI